MKVAKPIEPVKNRCVSTHRGTYNRFDLLAFSMLAAIYGGDLSAQESSGPAEESSPIEEVVVTGTATGTNIRNVAPTGSQVITLDREELVMEAVRDPAMIIANLPQGSSFGFREDAEGGNYQSSAINLRGLGNNATLVLIDGKRLQPGGVQNVFVDPNQIPFAAIERVEVVMDGASAVYGSDAIAGVVNYILRDDFEGLSITTRFNAGDVIGGYAGEVLWGHSFEDGNIIVGYSYENRDGYLKSERDYMSFDLRPLGGNDNRLDEDAPGAVGYIELADGTFYGIPTSYAGMPAGATGFTIPTAAEVTALQGQPNPVDPADFESWLPDRERGSWYTKLSWDISDRLTASYTGLFSRRTSTLLQWSPLTLGIDPASPLYIAGLDPANETYTVHYAPGLNGMPRYRIAEDDTNNSYLDIRYDLTSEWQLNASAMWGSTYNCGNCGIEENHLTQFEYSVKDPGWLNPYASGYQEGLENHFGYTYHMGFGEQTGFRAVVDGPAFELPAGTVRVAVGAERVDKKFRLKLDQSVRDYVGTMIVARDAPQSRDINSVYAEAYVPVVEQLDLSLAIRYDDYSDFGSTTNPRVGFNFFPTADIKLSGTWGKAFRAPTLTENNPGVRYGASARELINNVAAASGIPLTDPVDGTTTIISQSGNKEGLGPETAEMYSLGINYQPSQLPGLAVNLSYYNVDYANRIENLPGTNSALSSAQNFALYQRYVTVAPQPATCVPGDIATYNPIYIPVLTHPDRLASSDFLDECDAEALLEGGRLNTGKVVQSGIDLTASYTWATDLGQWHVSSALAEILDLKRELIPGAGLVEQLDRIGFQISRRASMKLGWQRESWQAALSATYIGPYLNDNTPTVNGAPLGNQEVPSWTTWDASFAWTAPDTDSASFMSGVRVSLAARNLLNEQPPIVLNDVMGFDPDVHNPNGRVWQLELTKSF